MSLPGQLSGVLVVVTWLEASLEQSLPALTTFSALASPHPMGYVLYHLEILELATRDSAAKFRTGPKEVSPCRGKSLTRRHLFWPLVESPHFCLSGKGCAFLRNCELVLLISCLLQGSRGCGFPCLFKLACCSRDASSTKQVTIFSTKSHLWSLPESYF